MVERSVGDEEELGQESAMWERLGGDDGRVAGDGHVGGTKAAVKEALPVRLALRHLHLPDLAVGFDLWG